MKIPSDHLKEKFLEYFHEVESYSLRSERFYESLHAFTNKDALAKSMTLWLEAAFMEGANVAMDHIDSIQTSKEKVNRTKEENEEKIAELMLEDHLDEDGYPTDAALDIIELWHWDDPKGWFKFIESIWHLRSWGWSEQDEEYELGEHFSHNRNNLVHRYYISTAGWSGNETIINSMQRNEMMWYLNWMQSKRGGHYVFELREIN